MGGGSATGHSRSSCGKWIRFYGVCQTGLSVSVTGYGEPFLRPGAFTPLHLRPSVPLSPMGYTAVSERDGERAPGLNAGSRVRPLTPLPAVANKTNTR